MPVPLSYRQREHLRSLGYKAVPLTPAAPVRKAIPAPPPPSPEEQLRAVVKSLVADGIPEHEAWLRTFDTHAALWAGYGKQHFANAKAEAAKLAKARSQALYNRVKR